MIRMIQHNGTTLYFVADDMGQPVSFGYPTRKQARDVAKLIDASGGMAAIPAGVDVEAVIAKESNTCTQ